MKRKDNLSRSSMLKIEKMYQAVVSLIEEGKNVNVIKVSDITQKAGIGKGTAYEYFETKEEIIAEALRFDAQRRLEVLAQTNQSAGSFKEEVFNTLEWIEKYLKQKNSAMQFFKSIEESKELPGKLVVEARKSCADERKNAWVMLRMQLERAKKDGVWQPQTPEAIAELGLFSAYVEYFIWLFRMEEGFEISDKSVKEYIYGSICAKLSAKFE